MDFYQYKNGEKEAVINAINARTVAVYLPPVAKMYLKEISSFGLSGGYFANKQLWKYLK